MRGYIFCPWLRLSVSQRNSRDVLRRLESSFSGMTFHASVCYMHQQVVSFCSAGDRASSGIPYTMG